MECETRPMGCFSLDQQPFCPAVSCIILVPVKCRQQQEVKEEVVARSDQGAGRGVSNPWKLFAYDASLSLVCPSHLSSLAALQTDSSPLWPTSSCRHMFPAARPPSPEIPVT